MGTVLVPVRYPLSDHSKRTLKRAIEEATARDAELAVLHVNPYQAKHEVTRHQLKAAVEAVVGTQPAARYLVDRAFIVEDQILDEIIAEDADVVVLGHKQLGRWRRTVNRLLDDPDIAEYLQDQVDVEFVVVGPED